MELTIDILGWLGTGMLVLAYILVSLKRVHGQTPLYQLLNLFGSILLGINSYYHGAMPSAGINIIWIGIGLWALYHILKTSRAPTPTH